MVTARHACLLFACTTLPLSLLGQQQPPPAYPEHNILSPFRKCDDVYAPPDAVYSQLRIMREIAEAPGAPKDFDREGREVVDDPRWKEARQKIAGLHLDAGYLAEIVRRSRNADERDLALYGMFFVTEPAHVFNLISHIPGEPEPRAREKAYPRAIAFVKAHIGRKWGELSDDEKTAMNLPQIGSPAAKAIGLTHAPHDADFLFNLNLAPFFQLLDLDKESDQAQGLWFLKECFLIRTDLAKAWLEPALPRIRQLLAQNSTPVREQAIGLLQAIGPKKLPTPAVTDATDKLLEWAKAAEHEMFPPIRVISEALITLFPGPEREALAVAGKQALLGDSVGDPVKGTTAGGKPYAGYHVIRVPDELQVLHVPAGAIITAVNGAPINDAKTLLAQIEKQLTVAQKQDAKGKPVPLPKQRTLYIEFLLADAPKAIEYRVML